MRSARPPSAATKSSIISAAGVPGRGEKTNVYAASYAAASTTSSVRGEVVLGLAGEADDEVGRDREVGDRGPRGGQALEVALGGVAAVHARERPVAPRLQREVQVLAHGAHSAIAAIVSGRRSFGCGDVNRMRSMPVDRVDRAQQVGELRAVLAGAEVATVRVDVLTEERDLAARRRPRAPRPRARCRRAGGSPPRPRTIGTMQNVHELSQPIWIVTHAECVDARAAGSDRRRARRRRGRAPRRSRRPGAPSARASSSSVGRAVQVVGAEHDVDVTGAARRSARGPSGPGSRRPRSGARVGAPSATSGGRGGRRACCRRSPGCSTC